MGGAAAIRHGQCPISSSGREALVLAENEAGLSRRRLAVDARGPQAGAPGNWRGFASADSGKQFALAISEAKPLFRSDRSRTRRLQRLRARGARPRRCARSPRFAGSSRRRPFVDKTPRKSAAHQAVRLPARRRTPARAPASAHRASSAVPAEYHPLTTNQSRACILEVDPMAQDGDNLVVLVLLGLR